MTFTAAQIKTGRRWAYVTMLAMLALSVAGNLAHTYHINPDPSARALTYAVMWPLMVWAGVELFVRLPWQAILTHRLVRWVGILLVAAIAALVSYRHLRGLLLADGEEWTVYTFGPLAVDGLMLMSTLGLLLTRSLKGWDEDGQAEAPNLEQDLVESSRKLVALIHEQEREIEALTSQLPAVPASREVEMHSITTGNGKTETYSLADLLPVPVSPAPAIPGLALGPVQPLPGWTPPVPVTDKPARKSRKTWDEGKAREMLLAGSTKAEVATAVGVDAKTIQRLRGRMIAAGELQGVTA